MISSVNRVIGRLPGNQVVVMKNKEANELYSKQDQAISRLKRRDQHVRNHEASHMGHYGLITVGSPSYSYTLGPDGKAYAIGGKVRITTAPSKNAYDALMKAQALKNAAMSVSDPSPQDFSAANAASVMEKEALNKIAAQSQSRAHKAYSQVNAAYKNTQAKNKVFQMFA